MLKFKFSIVFSFAALSFVHAAQFFPPERSVVLTRDGTPLATIVIPDSPGRAEPFAAAELQKYLEKISGAQLNIIAESVALDVLPSNETFIFIGKTRAAAPILAELQGRDPDAFIVKAERQDQRNNLFLVGPDDRGTVYAVYDFLEQELGCRWLAPDERWEEIPTLKTLALPLQTRLEEPAFKYRQDNSLDRTNWGMKQKANVCRILYFPFHWMDARFQEAPRLPFELRGLEDVHGAPRLVWGVSRDNPEWFALDEADLRYIEGGTARGKGQLCFSNPELHDLLAERLSQLFRERPELEFIESGCYDCLTRNYCRCESCLRWDALGDPERTGGKRGAQTHRWLAFANAVAERLAESDPGKKLLIAAYDSYQEPPDPQVITPAENVIVMYWSWAGCRLHTYQHPEHTVALDWIESWKQITPAGLVMSEYVSRSAMSGMTGTNPRRFIQDIRWLRENNFNGYNAFDAPNPWGLQIINRYVIAKMLWNTDSDGEALIKDFCNHAFHAASADMQDFIKLLEAGILESPCSGSYVIDWATPEVLAAAGHCLDSALAAVKDDEIASLRLREWEWHFRYMELAAPAYVLWLRALRAPRDDPHPEWMREAIRLGQAAEAYKKEKMQQYPNERFYVGWGVVKHLKEDWYPTLNRLEKRFEVLNNKKGDKK